jgi:hypothetical protein
LAVDVEAEALADVDSVDPRTVCMNDDHSELSDPSPSSLISSFSTTDSAAKLRLRERIGRVEGRREGAMMGEIERWDGRTAESSDADRTFEIRSPSSPTSSPIIPAHSILLLLSIGVPRPTYFISGQDPRGTEIPGTGEILDIDFFLIDFEGGAEETNDIDRTDGVDGDGEGEGVE